MIMPNGADSSECDIMGDFYPTVFMEMKATRLKLTLGY